MVMKSNSLGAIAVDVSKSMLSYAKTKATPTGAINIEFYHAGFLSHEPKDEHVDFIITKAPFNHLSDFCKTVRLTRMLQMLKSESILFSYMCTGKYSTREICYECFSSLGYFTLRQHLFFARCNY